MPPSPHLASYTYVTFLVHTLAILIYLKRPAVIHARFDPAIYPQILNIWGIVCTVKICLLLFYQYMHKKSRYVELILYLFTLCGEAFVLLLLETIGATWRAQHFVLVCSIGITTLQITKWLHESYTIKRCCNWIFA